MDNNDIKLNDDTQKLAKGNARKIAQDRLLQKVINNRVEKERKVKELVSNNPELSSYLTELSADLEDYRDSINEAHSILDILQNNLVLKVYYTDELDDELDSEINSIKVAKSILDEMLVKVADKVDAINDTANAKEN